MANWGNVQQGLVSGYEVGRSIGGGRMGQLGSLIKGVADRLRSERETGEETERKTGLLGVEGLIKGLIEPSPEGKLELPGIGRVSQVRAPKKWEPETKEEAIEFEKTKKSIYSEDYQKSLANAVKAIDEGADPWKVYQKMAVAFPKQSVNSKRTLIPSTKLGQLDIQDMLWGEK